MIADLTYFVSQLQSCKGSDLEFYKKYLINYMATTIRLVELHVTEKVMHLHLKQLH